MSDVSPTPQPTLLEALGLSPSAIPRRRFITRAVIATLIAGGAAGLGFKAFAHGPGGWHGAGFGHGPFGWHRAGFLGAPLDPARLDEHLDRMLKHLYVEIDATDAQQQQLAPIVKAAAQDLLPLRARMHDAHRQAIELLSQETIDRAALERLRADHLSLMEQASKRFTQALADVADVLTPEQRKQLTEHVGRRWHGRRG
jgi:protein CpxP